MKLDRFHIEDVRCFRGPQEVRIRPLTFLVGENSTGKTTVLGCLQALADYIHRRSFAAVSPIDFNQHPYEMGSFRDIVRKDRSSLKSFRVGATYQGAKGRRATYVAELCELDGGPRAEVRNVAWTFGDVQFLVHRGESHDDNKPSHVAISDDGVVSDDGTVVNLEFSDSVFDYLQSRPWMILPQRSDAPRVKTFINNFDPFLSKDDAIMRRPSLDFWPARSIAPVRSRPKRTSNPFDDTPDAEGTDVPATIAGIARKGGQQWASLKAQLEDFGHETGLFSEIAIRKIGTFGSDPFQLQIKTRGSRANLVDVGYGVSQVLPIMLCLAYPQRASMSLIQQPEVHLHPRAQAALSSILISVLGTSRRRRQAPTRFVIETHSDYMLDRARIEIRRGHISPDDVSFVYFEPLAQGGATVHNITFDEMGNMQGAPDTYQEFFLRETDAFLGLE